MRRLITHILVEDKKALKGHRTVSSHTAGKVIIDSRGQKYRVGPAGNLIKVGVEHA